MMAIILVKTMFKDTNANVKNEQFIENLTSMQLALM